MLNGVWGQLWFIRCINVTTVLFSWRHGKRNVRWRRGNCFRVPKKASVMWIKIVLHVGASKYYFEYNIRRQNQTDPFSKKQKLVEIIFDCFLILLIVSFNCVNVSYYMLNTSRENIISSTYQSNTSKVNFPVSRSAIMILHANLLKSFNI